MNTSGNSLAKDPFGNTNYPYAVFFAAIVPITITSNVLLLVTLYKDPLKCFRTPVTYFVVALASVDFSLGLLVEPIFAAYYFSLHYKGSVSKTEPIFVLFQIALWTGNAGLNTSFLQVLMLTLSQFIAITFPHKYKTLVTARRVLLSIVLSTVYFVFFTLLQFISVPVAAILKMDLYMHSTAITFLIAVANAFLFVAFRRFTKLSRSIGQGSLQVRGHRQENETKQRRSTRNADRQFTIITLSLSALLLFTAVPHILATYIKYYNYPTGSEKILTFRIVDRVCGGLMFVKVALDAFIFAWRLPKYRRALRVILKCSATEIAPENSLETLPCG